MAWSSCTRAWVAALSASGTLVSAVGVASAAPAAHEGEGHAGQQSSATVHEFTLAQHGTALAQRQDRTAVKSAAMRRSSQADTSPSRLLSEGGRLASRVARPARPLANSSSPSVPGTTPSGLTVTGSSGVLTLTATSTASYVLFEVDGRQLSGGPVAVDSTSGQSVASFPSWGYRNASHTATAADCDSADVSTCDLSAPASAAFEIANSSPSITRPLAGEHVTGGFTIAASSPGGGIKFFIDGRARGFDAKAPYRFEYSGSALTSGRHVLVAEECSTDGTLCAGPNSAQIPIVSESLHPQILRVSPLRFSPQRNGVKDTSTVTFRLPDREYVSISIVNAQGQVVRSSKLGQLSAQTHSWTWNGRTHSGHLPPSGRYDIVLKSQRTVRNTIVRGEVHRSVFVDDRPAYVSVPSTPKVIYPVRDGYRDALDFRIRLSEAARVSFVVRNARGRAVFHKNSVVRTGSFREHWNGRDAGHRLTPGTYSWTLASTDVAGNTWHGGTRHVVVSPKKLVTHVKTLTRNGDSYNSAGSTDSSCASYDKSLSQYKHGVWLLNTCFEETALAAVFFRFRVPAAVRYTRLAVQAGGFTQYPPSSLEAAIGVNGAGHDFTIPKLGEVPNDHEGWWKIGSLKGDGYVSARHSVLLGISLDSRDAPTDFDLGGVRLIVTYQVLSN